MPHGPKKWFMLQVWRLQQVAAILSLFLLIIPNSILIYGLVKWRGPIFENSYIMIPLICVSIGLIIWAIAIAWDLRLKMWRDQATVLVERNPYSKEKMSAKEIMVYGVLWLPLLENLGKTDPKAKVAADALKEWIRKASREEAVTERDLEDIFKYIGFGQKELMDFNSKK